MPRRPRIVVPGLPLHVTQRGVDRGACFFDAGDRVFWLAQLTELAAALDVAVHAYVQMTNHFHLLLTPALTEGPGLLMKHLGQRYVAYVNRTYARSGTLWEGRYRSCLVESEAYLLACMRYIELNPVRARLVTHPRDWPWSSFRANADGLADPAVTPHGLLLGLGTNGPVRRAAYRTLFDQPLADEAVTAIRRATAGNHALGSRRFAEEIARMLGRRVTPGRPGRRRDADTPEGLLPENVV